MADQGWTTQVAAAAGVAAGAGAAQLGLGYGLGVLVWPTTPTTGDAVWLGSLAWAVWIAAGSTVLGAVAAVRLGAATARPQVGTGALSRFVLVVAAAVGALPIAVLVAFPARSAVRADTFAGHWVAGGYAVLGILLGLIIAGWAATSRSVATNVVATTVWLWTLAVVAVVTGLRAGLLGTGVQLGHWRMTELGDRFFHGTIYWPAALLTIGAALLIGALAAWPGVRRYDLGLGTAASGAVGPLLVAAAYFTLAPQVTGARGMIESAYLIAPYTVLAGLAGSALVVALGNRRTVRRHVTSPTAASLRAPSRSATEPATPATAPADPPPVTPTTDRPPVGWLEPNGGAAARSAADRPVAAVAAVRPDSTRPDRGDRSARPAAATGRAKLPSPRTESTPPPAPAPTVTPPPVPPPPATPAPPRSTVKPPPEHPTVATINPPRPAAAVPSSAAPTAKAPASAAPAAAAPVAAAPTAAAPTAAAPTAKAAADGPAGKAQVSKGAAKAAPARGATKSSGAAARKSSRPAKAAAVPAFSNADGPPEPKPHVTPKERDAATAARSSAGDDAPVTSAVSAALAGGAPLWVDDAEAADADRDGIKDRLRRFGRRGGAANGPGSAN